MWDSGNFGCKIEKTTEKWNFMRRKVTMLNKKGKVSNSWQFSHM